MFTGDIAGCGVYYSRFNRGFGIPYSFECSVYSGRVGDSYSGVVGYARSAASLLGSLLGEELHVSGLEGWEFIGRAFNLYSYTLSRGGGRAGQVRVVEKGGVVLGVYGVLLGDDWGLPERPGPVIARGEVPRLVFLEPEPLEELPGGQKVVSRNPIYAVEGIQGAGPGWRVSVEGLVERGLSLTLDELLRLELERSGDPFHCVTGWTIKGRTWEGVRLSVLLEEARPGERASWVAGVSSGGYASMFPISYADDALLVLRVNGKPLRREEGAPVRLFVPPLYGWKHVKWLQRIVVLPGYEDGYWEALAYHERGLAGALERFKVRNLEIAESRKLPEGARMLRPPGA